MTAHESQEPSTDTLDEWEASVNATLDKEIKQKYGVLIVHLVSFARVIYCKIVKRSH